VDWAIKLNFSPLKTRILIWFGSIVFIILSLFSLSFNYFLNKSINNNIKNKLQFIAHKYEDHINTPNIGIAMIINDKVVKKNNDFSLQNFQKYLHKKKNFFILLHNKNDDYINALYIEKVGKSTIMVLKKNIDNKIENFQDILLFLIPILLLILIFLVSTLLDKVLIPINKLINATQNISVTKFTKEIEIPNKKDEIRELVLSFNAMIKRLKEGVERLDKFNSDVSHELKTPLTVIQGEAEITLRKLREPDVYINSLNTIQKQSKQIELIIKQLLLLTRYSIENIKNSFEICSLDTLLMDTIEKFQMQIDEKNIKLHIKQIEIINKEANKILIESIFSNLIDNAIKYTPKNKNITISLYKDSKIHFTIKDEGIGIDKKDISKITNRFYRADSSRNKKINGFGLGLSIVKNSVLMHDGEIHIKSKEDVGTTIFVQI